MIKLMARTIPLASPLTWLFIALFSPSGLAQDLKPLHLLFVDSHGEPIPGVKVDPVSLVFQLNTARSYSADNLTAADGGELRSDADGEIVIQPPNTRLGELVRFKLAAEHQSYARFDDWVSVSVGGITKVKLHRGVRIAVTAVAKEDASPITEGLFAISEQKDLDRLIDWTSNGRGLLLSRRLRSSDKRVRLVQILDGAPVRFSDVIDVAKVDGQRTLVANVPMSQALVLRGRLDDQVPRPITSGLVSVCAAWPTDEERLKYGPAGHWLATTNINEDGSFTVEGLPSCEYLQVIASCDGWFNKQAAAKLRASAFPKEFMTTEESILPALYQFDSSPSEIVVGMQPTGTAEILCVDPDGNPVSNAKVIARRSQRFIYGSWESRNFRHAFSTAKELLSLRDGPAYEITEPKELAARTDKQGIAKIDNLPGLHIEFRVENYRFSGGRVWQSIDLGLSQPGKLVIHRP